VVSIFSAWHVNVHGIGAAFGEHPSTEAVVVWQPGVVAFGVVLVISNHPNLVIKQRLCFEAPESCYVFKQKLKYYAAMLVVYQACMRPLKCKW